MAKQVSAASITLSTHGSQSAARRMAKRGVSSEYRRAFDEVLKKIQDQLKGAQPGVFPIRMYIAGGAALNLLTGERVTEDIDATFSKKILFNEDVQVSYRDADGRARLMYLDRNYNDTLGLLHAHAYEDAQSVNVAGIDKRLIEVRVLTPLDLAVSKLTRFTHQDRADIELLAKRGLLDSEALRKRAEEALQGYVGDLAPVRNSIEIACRLVDAHRPMRKRPKGGTS